MRVRYTGFLCLFLALLTTSLSGQDKEAVRKHFTHPDSVQWVTSFSGTWQGLHPVEMILGYDGHDYGGTFEAGGLLFELIGQKRENHLILQEIDADGKTSGYVIGEIRDGQFNGTWRSIDFSRSALLALRSEKVIQLRSFEPEILVMTGSFSGRRGTFVLQREEADLLSGMCSWNDHSAPVKLSGVCESPTCEKMTLTLHQTDAKKQPANITCTKHGANTYRMTMPGLGKEPTSGIVTITNRLPLIADVTYRYSGTIDVLYPKTNVPAVDSWLQQEIRAWKNTATTYLDSIDQAAGQPGPAERWCVGISAWVDITLFRPDIVSGMITQFDPVQKTYRRKTFAFDVKSGKQIQVEDLGRKAGLEEAILSDAEKHAKAEQTLRHVTLGPDGFIVFTDFNHATGESWKLLPYQNYTEQYKRNALVHALTEEK